MVLSWKLCCVLLLTFAQIYCRQLVNSQFDDSPTANLSTSWINNPYALNSRNYPDGSKMARILFRGTTYDGPRFACGFFCNGNCDTYLFAIFIVPTGYSWDDSTPPVVWSANRNHSVRINATLELTSEGNLVLQDVDGTIAWSTNTAGRSVAGLNLTETGNLVLYDINHATVWQSFDHPTDSLVLGQKLASGQKLTASFSATNWTQSGLYSLSVTSLGTLAFIDPNPPDAYYEFTPYGKESKEPTYVKYQNGSLTLYDEEKNYSMELIASPPALSVQYMRLGPDGHLRVYECGETCRDVADLLTNFIGVCGHPMVCGEYGVCSKGQQCGCPQSNDGTSYFKRKYDQQPDLGCSETNPLICEASRYHRFLELKYITYFTFRSADSDFTNTDVDSCKQACLKNCSCKAALFQYDWKSPTGNCYLASQMYSLIDNEARKDYYNSSAFLKVQISPSKTGRPVTIKVGASLGALFGLFSIIGILVFLVWKKRDADEDEEDYLDQVPGMATRFSYEELKTATEDFGKKLGEGGFGSVFEGTLSSGVKVAVKRLDGLGHIKKSFLAEVETIGSIHHVNLVRLIGFCAEKSHRLLVYEYMCNGSLDKWIFNKNHEVFLDWQHRRKIIFDIAKGLTYLHEDCRHKIVHLDIKPQNILLDENFNAKVSDFGLSKLINRDQSQVMTTMRGTPGYLAPEWLSSIITEKVDVYSYGVVVLEILCGRKNFDRSQPEECMHLLSLLKKKAEEEKLLDMVDKYSEDMQLHRVEVVEMMRVAAWCLQSDFTKRPSMSVVVKVLEGVMDVEHDLDYSFSNPPLPKTIAEVGHKEVKFGAATPLLPSILSGPR